MLTEAPFQTRFHLSPSSRAARQELLFYSKLRPAQRSSQSVDKNQTLVPKKVVVVIPMFRLQSSARSQYPGEQPHPDRPSVSK